VKAAEETEQSDPVSKATRVAWAFFWQTPGSMAPFLVALILHLCTTDVDTNFRIVLALGALPAFICWLATCSQPDTDTVSKKSSAPLSVLLRDTTHWKRLIGTGGSWFLYDVCYYGTALFAPDILKNILGDDEGIVPVCWHALVSNAMGIPGVIATIALYRYLGTKNLQILGFILSAVAYVLLALGFFFARHDYNLLFATYCFLIFTLNFGPNVTTFTLPQETFPAEVRSTFNGLSAAFAKVGAIVGILVYGPLAKGIGLAATLIVCAVVSALGAILTHFCVQKTPKSETLLGSTSEL
jgi:PHS family inorganic phosphate transporter-like MFS transporter